ncbi:MAG: hypothetical protein QOK43_2545 [Acidimicrobiaceae bacterium]|jgi:hypothetical protein|nr:hypothetical protein [Acidimicrobiaceae bacterium]MDQ1444003.1 hypothetical protein [Acidimicrobiaceae bacterium]
MIRTQLQLTEQQARALKREAGQRGVSIAEIIRQALDQYLSQGPSDVRRQRAMRSIGGYRSGRSNVSEDHDAHLADAFKA